MGQEFLTLSDPDDAESLIKSLKINKTTEKIPIKDSNRRVLAESIISPIDLPPFNRVSMDGYAVRAEDTFQASEEKPVLLRLIGSINAGTSYGKKITRGTCVEVATGAPMPSGADAVVMVEYTDNDGDNVVISEGVAPGQFFALQGSDVTKGQTVLHDGIYLTADKIGVLSAIGTDEVLVYNKTKVGIISTGNELIKANKTLKNGQIYDINSYSISAAVEDCGCEPLGPIIVKDDYNLLKESIINFEGADIIITSGGTSAGKGDVLREVVDDLGKVILHGIAFKPGKPTLIGKFNDKIIIGLPGYPVSALMVFKSFIEPFLRKIEQIPSHMDNELLKLKISRRIRSAKGRREYLLVKIKNNFAVPILKDSGAIASLADADGYVIIPKNIEYIEKNDVVEVKLFSY